MRTWPPLSSSWPLAAFVQGELGVDEVALVLQQVLDAAVLGGDELFVRGERPG